MKNTKFLFAIFALILGFSTPVTAGSKCCGQQEQTVHTSSACTSCSDCDDDCSCCESKSTSCANSSESLFSRLWCGTRNFFVGVFGSKTSQTQDDDAVVEVPVDQDEKDTEEDSIPFGKKA